jgi:branched-chain amino acid transport system ATP-binding protein
MPLLEVSGMSVQFGAVKALDHVSCQVDAGEVVGLIGPNGAGKTTFIDAITGFVRASGKTWIDGRDISRLPAHMRVRHGLTRTFQSMELFQDLTVRQNLMVSAENGVLRTGFQARRERGRRDEIVERSLETLNLTRFASMMPGPLSLGQQKLVAVARALASGARVLLLDEPAAGLDTEESLDFASHLRGAMANGVAIVLIDHDMDLVMSSCDRLLVLSFGRIVASGTPSEVSSNQLVRAAYLGNVEAGEASS